MFKILLSLLLLSTQIWADKNDIAKNLSPIFGKIALEDISQTPLAGIFEVITRNPIDSVLVSADGRYLIQGDVIDVSTRSKMPRSSNLKQLIKAEIDAVAESDKIIFKADNERYVIHVFTDVDCPFCKKLHFGVRKMNQLGITVKYLASPLAGLHPNAQSKMEKIWCASDRAKAMDNYKRRGVVPNSAACKNPVAAQLALSQKLGVNGTPSIFLADGSNIAGYLSPRNLLRMIKRSLKK